MRKVLWFLSFLLASPAAAADFSVTFTPSPTALIPFKAEIGAEASVTIKSVRFDMRKMNMGSFTFSPTKTGDNYTIDKVVLPPCRTKDKAWFMEILYSEGADAVQSKQVDFELQ